MTGLRVPDPTGLAAAAAMQQLLAPAQIILNGSMAVSEHLPDSGVDLMAVCEDEATLVLVKEKLDSLLEGEPPVHVYAITRAEFQGMAIMAQSFPGQAARYGVTADGQPLNYRPERQPSPVEVRDGADFWLQLARIELREFLLRSKHDRPWDRHTGSLHAQYAMQWAVKQLLYLDNAPVRYRRDIAVMWRHIQSVRPVTMPERIEAVEQLLAATAEPGGEGCLLTAFIHAHRRHLSIPVLGEEQWSSLCRHLDPAVNALLAEAEDRGGRGRTPRTDKM